MKPPPESAKDKERESWVEHQKDCMLSRGVAPCACGAEVSPECKGLGYVKKGYSCLYCDEWFCASCAEKHFGCSKEKWTEAKHTNSVVVKDHHIARLATSLHKAAPSVRRVIFSEILVNWKKEISK